MCPQIIPRVSDEISKRYVTGKFARAGQDFEHQRERMTWIADLIVSCQERKMRSLM